MEQALSYLLVGGLLFVAGLMSGIHIASRRTVEHDPETEEGPSQLEPDVDAEIDQAAQQWAQEHGRPELAGLLASKVRLAWRLRQNDPERRHS